MSSWSCGRNELTQDRGKTKNREVGQRAEWEQVKQGVRSRRHLLKSKELLGSLNPSFPISNLRDERCKSLVEGLGVTSRRRLSLLISIRFFRIFMKFAAFSKALKGSEERQRRRSRSRAGSAAPSPVQGISSLLCYDQIVLSLNHLGLNP